MTTLSSLELLNEKIYTGNKFIVMDDVNGLRHALVNDYVYETEGRAQEEVEFQKATYGRDCVIIPIETPIKERWEALEETYPKFHV